MRCVLDCTQSLGWGAMVEPQKELVSWGKLVNAPEQDQEFSATTQGDFIRQANIEMFP